MPRCRRARSGASARTPASTRRRCTRLVADDLERRQVEDHADRLQGLERDSRSWRAAPLGLAIGAEIRRESIELTPHDRNRARQHHRLSATPRTTALATSTPAMPSCRAGDEAARDQRRIALRLLLGRRQLATPKVGIKWTPLRARAARDVRARASVRRARRRTASAVSPRSRPPRIRVRCRPRHAPLRANCLRSPSSRRPIPTSSPRSRTSWTLGLVFEPTSRTSIAVDTWQITRKNEINQRGDAAQPSPRAKSSATRAARCPASPADPGPLVPCSAIRELVEDEVRGFDVELSKRFDLGGGYGRVTLTATVDAPVRVQADGGGRLVRDFAGTHGNCDITNCMGTPKDRVNLGAYVGSWSVPARRQHETTAQASTTSSSRTIRPVAPRTSRTAATAPAGCKIKSFTTFDLVGRWRPSKNWRSSASIQNVFDTQAADRLRRPTVPSATTRSTTAGAIGRFFRVGVKYQFS